VGRQRVGGNRGCSIPPRSVNHCQVAAEVESRFYEALVAGIVANVVTMGLVVVAYLNYQLFQDYLGK
jgi:hypothetical protein